MQAVRSHQAEREARGGDGARPQRRCIVTRAVRPKEALLRFVLAPDGTVVPDLGGILPGRGLWVSARREALEKAVAANAFARAARAPARPPEGLAATVEAQLVRRSLDLIGLARRAGKAVAGFEKVSEALRSGAGGLLLQASDGAPGGRAKLKGLARGLPVVDLFTGAELGAAFGRDFVVHAVVAGRFAERLRLEASRLSGFRAAAQGSGDE